VDLAEQSIYDFFLDELFSLEKHIYMFVERADEISEEKLALEKTIKNLKDENEILKLKLEQLEKESNNKSFNEDLFGDSGIDETGEREAIKTKIADLISKIDDHLRS
jgi:predicted  nucleic acid-binding Zn-ribbon protein